MVAHPDIFDEPEPLGKWVVASIVLHLSIGAALLAHTFIHGTTLQLGDRNGGGFGAVAVNTVATIDLPSKSGPTNPVAVDTSSNVPTPLPAKKPIAKVKAPDPDAIGIAKKDKRKPSPIAAAAPNKFREQQKFNEGQLYSSVGQQAVSPMLGRTGAGGVGMGTSSPFGTQFGYYANILQQTVARNWKTSDVDPRISSAPIVKVTVTIQRDGSAVPGSVRITQRSGIAPLDYSAQRAILESVPFPQLPQGFPKSQVDVEFSFEMRR